MTPNDLPPLAGLLAEAAPELVPVRVINAGPKGMLADVSGVRVRVTVRATEPPSWRCDAHPTKTGRDYCEHIGAVAAQTPTPTQLARFITARHITSTRPGAKRKRARK